MTHLPSNLEFGIEAWRSPICVFATLCMAATRGCISLGAHLIISLKQARNLRDPFLLPFAQVVDERDRLKDKRKAGRARIKT
ncbi:MAG: hypothetical protein OZ927_02295 [Alcaligenaceae bacterium]|nr:hypothetical protein [Alcaligenaceae bacterium]